MGRRQQSTAHHRPSFFIRRSAGTKIQSRPGLYYAQPNLAGYQWHSGNCLFPWRYRGGAEQKIRKHLIDNNYVDCVVQLPDNLFYGTSISTCIMVLKKSKRENSTLFIDASNEFIKAGNSNKLTDKNIAKIVAAFEARTDEDYFVRLVDNSDIAAQDYNLSVSTYVEQEDMREVVDIVKLNAEIDAIVARENVLRQEIAAIIAEIEGADA